MTHADKLAKALHDMIGSFEDYFCADNGQSVEQKQDVVKARQVLADYNASKVGDDEQKDEITRLQEDLEKVKSQRLTELYLSYFSYEDWEHGDDGMMRLGDWVILSWQDHNGHDHDDGYGVVVLHHDTEIPVILMVEGFEDDGEPHGTYAPICFHPWNTIGRVSEAVVRPAISRLQSLRIKD